MKIELREILVTTTYPWEHSIVLYQKKSVYMEDDNKVAEQTEQMVLFHINA